MRLLKQLLLRRPDHFCSLPQRLGGAGDRLSGPAASCNVACPHSLRLVLLPRGGANSGAVTFLPAVSFLSPSHYGSTLSPRLDSSLRSQQHTETSYVLVST